MTVCMLRTKLDRCLTGGLSATFTRGPVGQLTDAQFRRTLDHVAAAETSPGRRPEP